MRSEEFKTEEKFTGNRYEIVAWARGQKSLYYHEFGEYQGEWILLSVDMKNSYFIYKGIFGSCSGCDFYEAEMISDPTIEQAIKFSKDYVHFLKVPQRTMINLCQERTLLKIMPKNIRDEYSEISWEKAADTMVVSVKLHEGLPIELRDILEAKNAEHKQKCLKLFGYERFVSETNPIILDEEGENKLLKIGDIVFAFVKDSSTPRKYLLRVPPQFKTVQSAIAWTFDMKPEEYKPLIET